MSDWKEYKLGDVATLKTGKLNSNEAIKNGQYPFFTCSPTTLRIDKYAYDQKAILLAGNNAEGDFSIKYYEGKFNAYQRTYIIKSNEEVCNIKFLFYSLKLFLQEFKLISQGTSTRFLTASILNNMDIPLPPLEEQKQIAGILSSLDDKIDLLNKENATLEAMAETLFRHLFIENPNPTWKEGKLGDYVTETVGGEWGKEAPEDEFNVPVRCLRGADVADLNDGLANRTPLRYIKKSKFEKIVPHNGDIVLEISGGTDTCSTGRVAYINDGVKSLFDYPIVFSNFCRLLRVEERHSFFVYCFFRYLHKQGEFFNLENGSSGIHNLNYKAALYEMDWSVPTDEQAVIDFGKEVRPYFYKINANKKQMMTLTAQRDTLLPRLMSGEVEINRQ